MTPEWRTLEVARHARVGLVGDPASATSIWLILHGYGMLAQGILHWFRGAAASHRLLVAPEGLSRFYLEQPGVRRVGASWMTREDREHELDDLLAYLDQVADRFLPPAVPLQIHGFSQGVGVGARWLVHRRCPAERLVCWGAPIPPDVPPESLRALLPPEGLHLVTGSEDVRVPSVEIERDVERLTAAGLAPRLHRFTGGHRVDPAILEAMAG